MSHKNYTSVHHLTQTGPGDTVAQANDQQIQTKKQWAPMTGSHGKESEPLLTQKEVVSKSPEEEMIQEDEPQIKDPEVKKYVQVEKKEELTIDPKLKKAGLSAIDTTSLDPRYRVKLPISDEKIMEGLDKPLNSSFRWLAEFARYILKKGHLALKKIHGHVVRIIIQ